MSDKDEDKIVAEATRIANSQPMYLHADGCPYLISRRKQNCRCNCFSFAKMNIEKQLCENKSLTVQ